MADALTPAKFADKYLSMQVYIYPPEPGGPDNSLLAPSDWQNVSVAHYKLHLSPYREPIWRDIKSKLKDKTEIRIKTIDGADVVDELTESELWSAFRQPWVGKGSPEQVQIAIQLLYRYHKASTALSAFLVKDFIGLDCNGYAGNFCQRVMQGVNWKSQNNYKDPGPNASMEGLLGIGGPKAEIASLDEIDANATYVFVMCDAKTGRIAEPVGGTDTYGHVMLTEPGYKRKLNDGKVVLSVCEATAAGGAKLRTYVDYTVYPARKVGGKAVFHVERGNPNDTLDVRIAKFAFK